MPDRSDIIQNRITDLTDWGTYRDVLYDEVIRAGFKDPNNIIRSEFTPDHFHNPDLLADLIFKATKYHEDIYEAVRSSTSDLEILLTVNQARDQFNGEGSFNSTQDWFIQTGWTVHGGSAEASFDSLQQGQLYQDNTTVEVGKRYLFELNVAAYTSGTLRPMIRGTLDQLGPEITSAGQKQVVMLPNAQPTGFGLGVIVDDGLVAVIEDFVVRELPNV